MSRARVLSSVAVLSIAGVAATSTQAFAQTTNGYSVNQFEPAEQGSDWFTNESLDFRGKFRPAIGVLGDLATNQIRFFNYDGSTQGSLVADQVFVHVGASFTMLDRLRLGLSLPIGVYDTGTNLNYTGGGATAGTLYTAPDKAAVGDLRLGLDLRLLGKYRDPASLAIGAQVHLPTGSQQQFTGDGQASVTPRIMLAGDLWDLSYAARIGFLFRGRDDVFAGTQLGDAITGGFAIGIHAFDHHLLVGPEVAGQTLAKNAFKQATSPADALFGVHYSWSDWKVGVGAGGGLGDGYGSPSFRLLAGLEWSPAIEEKPADRDHDGIADKDDACPDVPGVATDNPQTNGCPPVVPKPADRDGDGILDSNDACPDVPGLKTDDPKTNGCPDRDGDGIPDAVDACPDVAGVASDDPKKNGCPADRDGDGIADKDDACPDVPGVKSDDPKKNGCPADRDGDGVADKDDACPDTPGIQSDDPKKNGCPALAAIQNGMIKITEQVQFATGSATILKASDNLMNAVLGILKEHPEIQLVHIQGHTDNKGNAKSNKVLSDKRAKAVMAWLTLKGIEKNRLDAEGFGQERPIDTNETDAGRQNNRRVEFHIAKTAPKAGSTP
jgi:outer membrane protein OmpA-like peptidoglycan-associated protein